MPLEQAARFGNILALEGLHDLAMFVSRLEQAL
jgi:hypothetical protein